MSDNNVNVNDLTSTSTNPTILFKLKQALPKLKPPKEKQASSSCSTKFITNPSCLPCLKSRGLKAPDQPDQIVDNNNNGLLETALESDHSAQVIQASTFQAFVNFRETLKAKFFTSKSGLGFREEDEASRSTPQKYLWNLARKQFVNGELKRSIIMNRENKFKMVRSVGEECVEEEELRILIANKPEPMCFNRFQPSGQLHIAQAIMATMNVNKLAKAGCKVKILIADQLARMNKKLEGDIEKIETSGRYVIEVWKAMGMNLEDDKVEIVWSSKEVGSRVHEYLDLVSDISDKTSLARLKRCWQMMEQTDEVVYLNASQISTLCMQCADIFFLQADICQLGMDKREVNVLARDYCAEIKSKKKPIVLSHHILPGLKEGQEKMSKSNPDTAIFMSDDEAEVNRKIEEAFCPEKVVEGNPCLEYVKYLAFPWFNGFIMEQTEHNGGDRFFKSFEDLSVHYQCGFVTPDDLKVALSRAINNILQPVRDHFEEDDTAKQLLQRVLSYEVKG